MAGFVLSTTAAVEGTPPPLSSSPPPPNPLSPLFSLLSSISLPLPSSIILSPSFPLLLLFLCPPSDLPRSSPPPQQEPTTKTRRSPRLREKTMKPCCLLRTPLPGLIDDGALVEKAGSNGGFPTREFEMDDIGWWKNFVVKLQMLFTFPLERVKKGGVLSMKLHGQVELY